MWLNRWWLSISTTSYVVLMMFGTQLMLEQQRYVVAGLFVLIAFLWPLYLEAQRDKILRTGIGAVGEARHQPSATRRTDNSG